MEDIEISELYTDVLAFSLDHNHKRMASVYTNKKDICQLTSLNKNTSRDSKLKFNIKQIANIKFSSSGDFIAALAK